MCAKYFDDVSEVWKNAQTWRSVFLSIFYNVTISWLYPVNGFRISFFIAWQYEPKMKSIQTESNGLDSGRSLHVFLVIPSVETVRSFPTPVN